MPITAEEANLHKLFTASAIYKMPMFQRRFAWATTSGDENGRRLWRDLDEVLESQVEKSFLGALVVKVDSMGPLRPDYIEIIDGQQRLTTLYMLLSAIVRYCEKNRETDIASTLASRYLIITGNSELPNVPKLQPTLKDTNQFNRTIRELRSIENPTLPVDSGDGTKLRKMFIFHMKEIENRCKIDGNHDVERLKDLIKKVTQQLSFVLIQVPDEYDENKVFETLNERGIPLSAGDLVRNLIFSNVGDDPQAAEAIYNNRWIPFENMFTFGESDRFNGYFYPFGLSIDPNLKKNSLYRVLKQKWSGKSADEIITLLERHIPSYRALVFGLEAVDSSIFEDEQLRKRIDRLYRLKIPTSMYSYLFNLLTSTTENSDIREVVRCLDIIESILVRRSFMDIEPTGIHGLFKGMWQTCGNKPDAQALFDIINRTPYFKYPSDNDFSTGVIGKGTNFYSRKIANYICSEYEFSLHNSGDRPSLENITREHIIPQNPLEHNDYNITEEDMENWLNTWANICILTGQANSEIQNANWREKRDYYQNESIFKSTRKIAQENPSMGIRELEHRSEELVRFAIVRWPRLPN